MRRYSTGMRLVYLESPYNAPDEKGIQENVNYARRCVKDCLARGESPYASHLFFTQPGVLDDRVPDERTMGMEAGFAWGRHAKATAVYLDRGLSNGMRVGILRALREGRRVECRALQVPIGTMAWAMMGPWEEFGSVVGLSFSGTLVFG